MKRADEWTQPRFAAEKPGAAMHSAPRLPPSRHPGGLGIFERAGALLVLLAWLVLFAGGIMIDSKPYRYAISPEGVWAMDDTLDEPEEARYRPSGGVPHPVQAWAVVLFFYLPLNLALICVTAGALGALGNRANLQSDEDVRDSTDNSSPYASAMLRGFFIYLFLTSGLLLLDDNPFDSPSPGQYIRLAGFLSLMSFVVNYQPHVFSQLVTWAFQRIQARGGEPEAPLPEGTVQYTRTTADVVAVRAEVDQIVQAGPTGDGLPASDEAARDAVR